MSKKLYLALFLWGPPTLYAYKTGEIPSLFICLWDSMDLCFLFCYLFLPVCLSFLGPHPKYMEVPRLQVKLELQLLAEATQIQALSVTYTTAQGNARSLTH